MKIFLKYRKLIIFYAVIAIITYGLALRIEFLNNNPSYEKNSAIVISLR